MFGYAPGLDAGSITIGSAYSIIKGFFDFDFQIYRHLYRQKFNAAPVFTTKARIK